MKDRRLTEQVEDEARADTLDAEEMDAETWDFILKATAEAGRQLRENGRYEGHTAHPLTDAI